MATALFTGQALAGGMMVAAPASALRWTAGTGGRPPGWIVRVLGGRMAAQAAVLEWVRRHRGADEAAALRCGAAVDALHGLSMVGAAAIYPRYRRSALLSAGMAFSAAAISGLASR